MKQDKFYETLQSFKMTIIVEIWMAALVLAFSFSLIGYFIATRQTFSLLIMGISMVALWFFLLYLRKKSLSIKINKRRRR